MVKFIDKVKADTTLNSKFNINDLNEEFEDQRENLEQEFDEDTFGNEEEPHTPLGDNYGEFVRWKQDQLEEVIKKINKLNYFKKASTDLKKINAELAIEREKKRTLEDQLDKLQDNSVKYMFRAMFQDIKNIKDALSGDSDIISIDGIRDKIDFYDTFIRGNNVEYAAGSLREYNLPEFDKLVSQVTELRDAYSSLVKGKVIQMLDENEVVQETVKNYNLQTGENLKVSDLITATSDLNWFDTNLMGVMSSNTNDTVLPQFLQMLMSRAMARNTTVADALIENLHEVEKRTKLYNPSWIIGKNNKGENNGNLIDLYSEDWYDAYKEFSKLKGEYYKNRNKNTHTAVLGWLASNTTLQDFTKIPAIREAYANNPRYAKYFKSTKEEAEAWEEVKRKEWGPKYDDMVHKISQILMNFDEELNAGTHEESYLAQNNLWEYLENVRNGEKNPQNIKFGDNKMGFFNAFDSIPFFPKTTPIKQRDFLGNEIDIERNFINKEFQDIVMTNQDNLDYYSAMKDISEYINNTYMSNTTGRLSYPKIKKSWIEGSHETLQAIKSGKISGLKDLSMDSLHHWKALFYEQGGVKVENSEVHTNYTDSSKAEIKQYYEMYLASGMSRDEAYKKASEEVLKQYSTDISRDLKAVAQMAAIHNARIEMAPTAEAVFDVYKNVKGTDKKGNIVERTNGIKKLEYYIDHVIYNNINKYRDSSKYEGKSWKPALKPLLEVLSGVTKGKIGDKAFDLLSSSEKDILEGYRDILESGKMPDTIKIKNSKFNFEKKKVIKDGSTETKYLVDGKLVSQDKFEDTFKEYVQDKIESLGLDLNLAGFTDGILKTVIIKSLALNPISGIFNRIEGLNSAYIMDATGDYWTPGNIQRAKIMMAGWNIKKISKGAIKSRTTKEKAKQMNIFEQLIRRMPGVLQDRKNEIQRNNNDEKLTLSDINLFSLAVELPESKNQGSIMLAKMMDFVLKDKDGNDILNADGTKMTLIDPNTGTFNGFELTIEGLLTAKPGFEHLLDMNTFENLIIDMTIAISRSQGNYATNDIMLAKKNIWGRAGTMFLTWLPEHINQRFGVSQQGQVDLYSRGKKPDGRYVKAFKSNKLNALTMFAVGGLGISYGMLGAVGLIGGGLVSAWVFKNYLSKYMNGDVNNQREVNHIQEFVQMLFSIAIEFANYPGHLLSSVPGINKLQFKNNAFKGTTMTEEDIRAMKAMTRELAIMLSWLSFKMMVMALYKGIGGDDDDDESPRRMKYYWVQNQLSRSITTLNGFQNPYAFVKDYSRNAFLTELTNISKLMYSIGSFNWDGVQENWTAPIPVPVMADRTVRNIVGDRQAIYEDKIDYASQVDFNKIPSPLRWTTILTKDYFTDGEYSKEKAYKDARKEVRDKMKQDLLDKYDGDKEKVDAILRKKMQEEVGSKYSELSYEDATQMIEDGEVIKDPSKKKGKASQATREAFKDKLKEKGLTSSEIQDIMREEFRGR